VPLLEKLAQTGKKELVIIADEVEGEAMATFVLNKLRGSIYCPSCQSTWLWRP